MHVLVQTLHMMMVWVLRLADMVLVADDRHAILTQGAVHVSGAVQGLIGTINKGFNQQGMALQMRSRQDFKIRPSATTRLDEGIDALQKHAGEKKIRLNHDPAKSHPFANGKRFL